MSVRLISEGVLLIFLAAAVQSDFRCMKIRNRLILIGLLTGGVLQICADGAQAIPKVLLNISFPVILLYLFYLIGALGAGDIKLFSVVGAFLNFKMLMVSIGCSFVIGAVLSVLKLIQGGHMWQALSEGGSYLLHRAMGRDEEFHRDAASLIHFSLSILLGTICAVIWWHFFYS